MAGRRGHRAQAARLGRTAQAARFLCRLVLLLCVLGLGTGCFKDRIEEALTIGVSADGEGTVHYAVRFHDVKLHGEDARARVEEFQRFLIDGTADWPRALASTSERSVVGSEQRLEEGQLVEFSAWSRTEDLERALPELFSHTGIYAQVERRADEIEISLQPGQPQGGDRRQRQRMERLLDDWSDSLADYIETVAALWEHIEANPGRRMTVLSAVFADVVENQGSERETTGLEKGLLLRYEEAESRVAEIFETPKGEARNAQELSRLVYDPYQNEVVLAFTDASGKALTTPPQVVEGLEAEGDRAWSVPRTSLWDALRSLEGHWIAPDPLVAKILLVLTGTEDEEFDVGEFGARQIVVGPAPSSEDIKSELLLRLRSPEVSRIVWAIEKNSRAF